MSKIVLLLATWVSLGFADSIDWKLTLLGSLKDAGALLERTDPTRFSTVDMDEQKMVEKAWADNRVEMVNLLNRVKVAHITTENPNDECIQILDLASGTMQVSRDVCRGLTARNYQREILRELFLVVAKLSDDDARTAAFALEDGWFNNRAHLPIFDVVGTYKLQSSDGTSLTVRISPRDPKEDLAAILPNYRRANLFSDEDSFHSDVRNHYNIEVDSLVNSNGEKLQFKRLKMRDSKWGTAYAKNPGHRTMRWGGLVSKTGYGDEHIEVFFSAPNKIRIMYRGRTTLWEHATTIYSNSDAFIRPLKSATFKYSGEKQ